MRTEIFAALSEVAARENEINAARVRSSEETTRLMTQTYNQAIADQTASLLRLQQIESDRVNLQSLLFDFQMKTANTATKEQLIFDRILALRKELNHELKQEDRNWKEIKAIQTEIGKTYGLAAQLQDKYFRTSVKIGESTRENGRRQEVWKQIVTKGSRRIENLMASITRDVKAVNKEHSKFPVTQKDTIDKMEERIDKQKKEVAVIKEIETRQKEIKELIESTNQAQVTTIGNMATAVNELTNAYKEAGKAALYYNTIMGPTGGLRYVLSPELWEEVTETMEGFNSSLITIKENLASAQEQGFFSPEQLAETRQALNELLAAYYGGLGKHVKIEGFEEFLKTLRDAMENTRILTEQKNSLKNKFENIQYAIETASGEAKSFKMALEDLGTTGEMGQQAIQGAANVTTASLSRMLIWLNMSLRTTRQNIDALNEAIRKAEELNRVTQSQPATPLQEWAGGHITRFATGGSVASDTINALLRPGEFVMNKTAARRYFPQLVAMNSGASRFDSGGEVVNNNIGDINVTVKGGNTSEITVRRIASELRRELKRGTVRLN
jgi:hypothetical protein